MLVKFWLRHALIENAATLGFEHVDPILITFLVPKCGLPSAYDMGTHRFEELKGVGVILLFLSRVVLFLLLVVVE